MIPRSLLLRTKGSKLRLMNEILLEIRIMNKRTIGLLLLCAFVICPAVQATSTTALTGALHDLLKHIDAEAPLPADEINLRAQVIQKDAKFIGTAPLLIRQAFAVVDAYENTSGPLFMGS